VCARLLSKGSNLPVAISIIGTIGGFYVYGIMGLILVQNIFKGGTDAVNKINDEVLKGIDDMFADTDDKLVVYPTSRKITLEQKSQGDGFAFSVRNNDLDEKDFTYTVGVDAGFDIQTKCKKTKAEVDTWLDINSGSFTLAGSSRMEKSEIPLVTFNIPEDQKIIDDLIGMWNKNSILATLYDETIEALENGGFIVDKFQNGIFWGAPTPFSNSWIGVKNITKLNAKISNSLPYWIVSTWYFTAKKRE